VIKLYREVGGVLRYHEAWPTEAGVTEHWGVVGERGETRAHPVDPGRTPSEVIEAILQPAIDDGYAPIDDERMVTVVIEYPIEGMGASDDLDRRHDLEERMDETLGWTGLGHCDGGSIGSGSMEVFCIVIDADIARRTITDDLRDTAHAGHSRIALLET